MATGCGHPCCRIADNGYPVHLRPPASAPNCTRAGDPHTRPASGPPAPGRSIRIMTSVLETCETVVTTPTPGDASHMARRLHPNGPAHRGRRPALVLAGALMTAVAACSSGGTTDDGTTGGSAPASARARGADVARPEVTGPVTGGTRGQPFNAMSTQLADRLAYTEEEYVIGGDATAYAADGALGDDGHWAVTETGTQPYRTRILVRRPRDAQRFDGTVFVEWLNVTAGVDGDPDFGLIHDELARHGSAWVGVSAQKVGVEGGGGALPVDVPGVQIQALKEWDPQRYGSLAHPGDPYSYDIYSQAAQAVRHPDGPDVLGGLVPRHVIAVGESQSAFRLVTYVDAVHPRDRIFDGFLIHSRGGGGAALGESANVLGEGTARIRDDLDVPVLQFLTETDLVGVVGFHRAEQDDTDRLRTWEVAGTAHADRSLLDHGRDSTVGQPGGDPGADLAAQCGSINEGSQGHVLRAAVAALRSWVTEGSAPPHAPRIEVAGDAIARDGRGIARGGIRTPAVDAPVSVLTGEAPPGRSVLCMLFGDTRLFDAATLAALYPTHQDYVDAVTASADAAVTAGFLLRPDADAIVASSRDAAVPG